MEASPRKGKDSAGENVSSRKEREAKSKGGDEEKRGRRQM
jgi:hypothetical protein